MTTKEITLYTIKENLNEKRHQLNELVNQKNLVITDDILRISQEIDILIITYYKKLNSSQI
ncbi:aspartyl-phosphate phosphatase Spo0E family protein [Clostridium beijerinckii]|uniref:Spo0E family sporulation regulatory protein-aspartic acid phosphatase n=1 Tax=Clostridium beijerinckii TaxID=1520 RepID=A0AAW3W904_CLOBE|nr:aspartyl-phosphate phosphatase Spo0E family protein [Clostridium beijerinckii]MBC2457741.1 Spo0E family sporulation regulatory protein-aspartic acid phosphatase [Clostridium beijerinckii]MBC2475067.1 Spo0E family sporulation regulatory protein-aspartic acid phosphatase [Clostridium beijerinckii]NOV63536.1 plasmid maintenance system antidote protein VapI [Clostridium beijerinckii]NOV73258.1 plasmid maintenance system antidote protein VapI [Clostridium beijerinckii]NOW35396.1 plasmid maintena